MSNLILTKGSVEKRKRTFITSIFIGIHTETTFPPPLASSPINNTITIMVKYDAVILGAGGEPVFPSSSSYYEMIRLDLTLSMPNNA